MNANAQKEREKIDKQKYFLNILAVLFKTF